jgi:2-C-methyl-D-erythritol 4-phosphate cytidylyltransferase
MKSKPAYWVVIPAAGIGERMQADRPKQYLLVNGKPLLSHVIDTFTALPCVKKVIVVLHAQDNWWPTLPQSFSDKVLTAIGGRERVHSVLLGLSFLKDYADDNDWVLVHDAARPCIQHDTIMRLIDGVKDHPVGGILGLPVVDTLKKVNDDEIVQTVSRKSIWHAQTPQLFRFGLLQSCILTALEKNAAVTDESSAIEFCNHSPKMILGDARNIKVTYPEDLKLAESVC